MGSTVVVVRIPRDLKEKMREVDINWSEEIRAFIRRRIKEYELRSSLREIRERAKKRRVSVDSARLIREDRDRR